MLISQYPYDGWEKIGEGHKEFSLNGTNKNFFQMLQIRIIRRRGDFLMDSKRLIIPPFPIIAVSSFPEHVTWVERSAPLELTIPYSSSNVWVHVNPQRRADVPFWESACLYQERYGICLYWERGFRFGLIRKQIFLYLLTNYRTVTEGTFYLGPFIISCG